MSWDILSKANLQYLLTRLKEVTNSFVNWKIHDELGAKNLIKYPYYDISGDGDYWYDYAGMDITCDKYGTIYFNGTSTHSIELSLSEYEINVSDGDYVLTFNTSMTTQHALLKVSYKETPTHSIVICSLNPGESITLSLSSGIGYKIQLQLYSGETCNNDYVKPILTHAEDNDSTYMPYAKSNLDLTVDLNSEISRSQEFGVKNIFDTGDKLPHTFNDGVVCSLASDGSINISGTSTKADEGIGFSKEYVLDGTYTLYYITNDFSTRMQCQKYINGVADTAFVLPLSGYLTTEFTKENNTTYKFELHVKRGVHDGGNIKFMISKGPFTDYNWQPYTMTNRELTLKAMQPNGHKVIDDAGTTLPQKDNLKFGGVYSHNTTDDSVVDIVREFQSASDIEALTGEEAKGFQHIPDTVYRGRTASDIGFDKTGTSFNSTRVQDVLEEVDGRLNSYSTTEKVIGTWIDGKPIYQKTVSCGALPNNSSTTTAHGITGISKVIEITGYAFNGGNTIPLPFINAQNTNSKAGVYANKVNIFISTGAVDLSEYSESYITLKYIKNT